MNLTTLLCHRSGSEGAYRHHTRMKIPCRTVSWPGFTASFLWVGAKPANTSIFLLKPGEQGELKQTSPTEGDPWGAPTEGTPNAQYSGLFIGHGLTRGSGQEHFDKCHGSGRLGTGGVRTFTGWVKSGQKVYKISRVGSGRSDLTKIISRVGSGRVGSGAVWIFAYRISPVGLDQNGNKNLTRRVGSGRVGSGRVGSGRVGSGRVGSGRVGSGRVGSGRFGSP